MLQKKAIGNVTKKAFTHNCSFTTTVKKSLARLKTNLHLAKLVTKNPCFKAQAD